MVLSLLTEEESGTGDAAVRPVCWDQGDGACRSPEPHLAHHTPALMGHSHATSQHLRLPEGRKEGGLGIRQTGQGPM